MNKEIMKLDIKGLQCDNLECDFVDMSISVEEYGEWANKPCPKCGKVLLTDADYSNIKTLMKMQEIVNQYHIIGIDYGQDKDKTIETKIKMDGSGRMKFENVL